MRSRYLLNIKNNKYLSSYTNKIIFTILYFIPYLNIWFRRSLIKTYYLKLKVKYAE